MQPLSTAISSTVTPTVYLQSAGTEGIAIAERNYCTVDTNKQSSKPQSYYWFQATTVFAADAVARLSGTVGIAAVTAGPGLTNTVTAVKNAQMAESPVLLIGGAAATILKVKKCVKCQS